MRETLFTPMKVGKGPKDAMEVGDLRVTVGITQSGHVFSRRDLWKQLKDPHQKLEPFVGETHFIQRQ